MYGHSRNDCDCSHVAAAAAAAKSLQSSPTLHDPKDSSPPGSPIPGILQARTLEWVAISFSNAWKWKVKVKSLSCVRLLAIPWTAAHQAPPSTGCSRQEYWSGLPLPSPLMLLMVYKYRCQRFKPLSVCWSPRAWQDHWVWLVGKDWQVFNWIIRNSTEFLNT